MRKRKHRNAREEQKVLRSWGRTAVYTAILLMVIVVFWLVLRPMLVEKNPDTWKAAVTLTATEQAAGAEDGSGVAGTTALGEGMTADYSVPGWQHNDNGWWYAFNGATCYVNGWIEVDGNKYHLDANGYMDTGWVPIGGQGYYFNKDGVYMPDVTSDKMVALTFDDGPSEFTSQLLDILEENGSQATFLMLGTEIEKHGADTIPRMKALGCTIGNHSYDHTFLMDKDNQTIIDQFTRTDSLIAEYNDGQGASVYRFPYGDYTKEQEAVTGMPCLFWDLDSMDWDSKDANVISQKILNDAETGNIILFHDIYQSTIDACAIFIPQLIEQGYQFVSIDELAAARGYELKPGVTYYGFTDANIENGNVTDENRDTVE